MPSPAKALLTLDEFLTAQFDPSLGAAPELWDGEVWYRAMGRPSHNSSQRRIGAALGELEPDDPEAPGWWILPEQDWKLGPRRLLRPDIAGWRRERLPVVPEGAIDLRPDWACELLSPGSEEHDLKFKAEVYLSAGVPWYWIVHPDGGVVQVLRNAGESWSIHGTWTRPDVARIPPFEELELTVARLFLPVRRG